MGSLDLGVCVSLMLDPPFSHQCEGRRGAGNSPSAPEQQPVVCKLIAIPVRLQEGSKLNLKQACGEEHPCCIWEDFSRNMMFMQTPPVEEQDWGPLHT